MGYGRCCDGYLNLIDSAAYDAAMKVAVIGAGVVGVTTAYYLNELGVEVTVFDAASGPATLTSHSNAGQLSYSFTDSLADPALIPKLPGILLGRDAGLRINPSIHPEFLAWGLRFLSNCRGQLADDS